MILGQLVQTGRRFCECRSHDFIPRSDTVHTIISYTVNDRFLARNFSEPYPAETHHELHEWMASVTAIAYIQISRYSNPSQAEFPPPLGYHSGDILTITAATPEALTHATFSITWLRNPQAVRLVNLNSRPHPSSFARQNHFLEVLAESNEAVVPFSQSDKTEDLLVAH